MLLNNPLFDVDNLLNELKKEIPQPKPSGKGAPTQLKVLQRKIKEHYFNGQTMSNEDALKQVSSPAFNDFPRLKHVLWRIFNDNSVIQIPEELKDWEPTVSFESLNKTYGYFDLELDLSYLFNRLSVACHKMTSIVEKQAHDDAMAYKLMALFYNFTKTQDENFKLISEKFNKVIKKKQDRPIQTPYHDAFVTILNRFPKFNEVKDFVSWKKFIESNGFKALNIFAQCAQVQPAFKNMDEAQEFLLKQTYPRAHENQNLAKLCKSMMIPNDGFEAGLEEVKTGWPKKEIDNLPFVNIADNDNKYFWVKLPTQDMRAMYLGNMIPGCCQFINGHSQQCVKDGISLSDNGFYVLLKAKKQSSNSPRIQDNQINTKDYEIVAQSYAWKTNHGNLCLDSIEWNEQRVSSSKIQELMSKFSKQVFEEHAAIKYINVGTGGQTPSDIYPRCIINETMKQGVMYHDAKEQYCIQSNIPSNIIEELKERLKSYPKNFRNKLIYLAPYFQDTTWLPDALFRVNPNIIKDLVNLNLCSIPNLSIDDFKHVSFADYQKMDVSEQSKISSFCKILNSRDKRELLNWLPTIPDEELSLILLTDYFDHLDIYIQVIKRLTADQRLEAVKGKNRLDDNVLMHCALNPARPEKFKMILELLLPQQRLEVLNEKNDEGETALMHWASNPEGLKMTLELLPPQQRLEALKKINSNNDTVLSKVSSDPALLKMILDLLYPQQRLEFLKKIRVHGYSLLNSGLNPALFKVILELLPPQQGLEALNEILEHNPFVLYTARSEPALLKMILDLLYPQQRLEFLKKIRVQEFSLLNSGLNLALFKIILELLPPQQGLEALNEILEHNTFVVYEARYEPALFKSILELLPPQQFAEAFNMAKSKIFDYGGEVDTALITSKMEELNTLHKELFQTPLAVIRSPTIEDLNKIVLTIKHKMIDFIANNQAHLQPGTQMPAITDSMEKIKEDFLIVQKNIHENPNNGFHSFKRTL